MGLALSHLDVPGRRLCRKELRLLLTATTAAFGLFFFFFFLGPSSSFLGGLGGGANMLRGCSCGSGFVSGADLFSDADAVGSAVLVRLASGSASMLIKLHREYTSETKLYNNNNLRVMVSLTCYGGLELALLGLWFNDLGRASTDGHVVAATARDTL